MQPYYTLAAFAEAQITEKKSLFIAAAAPAGTEEEALDFGAAPRHAPHGKPQCLCLCAARGRAHAL